jgi:hypothetical protein
VSYDPGRAQGGHATFDQPGRARTRVLVPARRSAATIRCSTIRARCQRRPSGSRDLIGVQKKILGDHARCKRLNAHARARTGRLKEGDRKLTVFPQRSHSERRSRNETVRPASPNQESPMTTPSTMPGPPEAYMPGPLRPYVPGPRRAASEHCEPGSVAGKECVLPTIPRVDIGRRVCVCRSPVTEGHADWICRPLASP